MEAPENLVEAVTRLKPRAVLLLDTNTLMNPPRLDSYEIAAQGRFLLVVPRIVSIELAKIRRGGRDEESKRKASRPLKLLDELYERGRPVEGIDIGDGRWLVTADTPRPPTPNDTSIEDKMIQKNLGPVDAALLRLADVCSEGLSDTTTLLVTADRDLMRDAQNKGLNVCRLSSLRSPEALEKMLRGERPGVELDILEAISASSDPDEERPVKIAMTLEELRSEQDQLIARGSGRLTYDNVRYPFRWTFPYRDKGKAWDAHLAEISDEHDDVRFFDVALPWDLVHEEEEVMPIENLDFMGVDERITEPVKRFACDMLEGYANVDGGLHSPLVRVRLSMLFLMGQGEWWPYHLSDYYRQLRAKWWKSQEEVDIYDDLSEQHNQLLRSLFDGTARSFAGTYRKALELHGRLMELQDDDERYLTFDEPAEALEMSLGAVLDTWSVGETREEEFTHQPFEWPPEAVEPQGVEDDEEGAVEDGEDEFVDIND